MGEALGSAGVRKLYLDVSEEPAQSTPGSVRAADT